MKRLLKVGIGLVVLALVVAAAGALWLRARVMEPYRGFADAEVFVEIPSGESTVGIGRRLVDAGVIRDEWTFRVAWRWLGRGRTLKAGEYRFAEAASPAQVLDRIARGDVVLLALTFPEGLTVDEMADLFARQEFGSAGDFRQAASAGTKIHDIDPAADTLEGYLFPDTYRLPRRTTAAQLVEHMLARFREVFDPAWAEAAQARGLTVRQWMALASLVEKETARGDERPLVSAVYHNRFRIGMPMQADPTVIFALKRRGEWDGNLTRANLQVDSPYNTYRYPGLPPGPIAAPGRAAMEAAAHPADVDYLYFVSRNDGSHVFSTTLEEHNRNVREWQVQYFRRQREMRK